MQRTGSQCQSLPLDYKIYKKYVLILLFFWKRLHIIIVENNIDFFSGRASRAQIIVFLRIVLDFSDFWTLIIVSVQ